MREASKKFLHSNEMNNLLTCKTADILVYFTSLQIHTEDGKEMV